MENEHIPPQVTGKKLDITEKRRFPTHTEAFNAFTRTRLRLLDVNHWHEIAGAPSAQFCLIGLDGQPAAGHPQLGNYVRIDIPGPGSPKGDGYDWVAVTHMEDKPMQGFTQFTLRPSPPPTTDSSDVAHFFHQYASSTFQISVYENELHISYFGRNEEINLENDDFVDNFRNAIIGLGAKLGFSYPQWKKLVHGLLEESDK